MDFEEVQDHLFDRLVALGVTNGFEAFETAVPQGHVLQHDNGYLIPYALISFGGKSPVAATNQGICGTKGDLKWTSVAIECVGSSQSDARKLARIVRGAFEGYSPDGTWGELVERLSGDYTVQQPDADMWPVRYATGIVYNTNANA